MGYILHINRCRISCINCINGKYAKELEDENVGFQDVPQKDWSEDGRNTFCLRGGWLETTQTHTWLFFQLFLYFWQWSLNRSHFGEDENNANAWSIWGISLNKSAWRYEVWGPVSFYVPCLSFWALLVLRLSYRGSFDHWRHWGYQWTLSWYFDLRSAFLWYFGEQR